jgi:hypothetical protein
MRLGVCWPSWCERSDNVGNSGKIQACMFQECLEFWGAGAAAANNLVCGLPIDLIVAFPKECMRRHHQSCRASRGERGCCRWAGRRKCASSRCCGMAETWTGSWHEGRGIQSRAECRDTLSSACRDPAGDQNETQNLTRHSSTCSELAVSTSMNDF